MTAAQTSGPLARVRRLLSAPLEEVFAAWTDADSLKQWLCPGSATVTAATADARVGGRFRVVMRDRGRDYEHTGEYREVQPPNRLVFTWRSPATGGRDTLVTVELRPHGQGTEMVLTHERLPDQAAADQHTKGWGSIAVKLDTYLTRGDTP